MIEVDHVMDDIWLADHKPIRGGNVLVTAGAFDPNDPGTWSDENLPPGYTWKAVSDAEEHLYDDQGNDISEIVWNKSSSRKRAGEDTNADGADPEDVRAENDDNTVKGNDGSETDGAENKSARRNHADHADERDHGLRGNCPTCTGSGSLYDTNDCPVCGGSGDLNKPASPKTTWTPPDYQSKGSSRRHAVDDEDEPENTETTKSDDQHIEEQSDEDHKVSSFDDSEESEEDESDPDDGFGGKKAPPFGSKDASSYFTCLDCDGNGHAHGHKCDTCQGSGTVKDSRRAALRSLADDRADDYLDDDGVNYDSDGEGHSDAYWNSIADDGPDGPPGEDKHSDPFVQQQRDKEKNSRRKNAGIDPRNITIPNYYFIESVSGQTYTDTADLSMATDLADKLAAQKGEDFIVISQQGTVYHTGTGMAYGRKALRQIASEEPTFSPPNGISGKWTCNSCGKDVGGVHALSDHVDAHRETDKPGDKESSRRHAGVDNSSMGDYARLNDDNWSLFI